jgi:transcriptional regulator GlxA family with amidase domain
VCSGSVILAAAGILDGRRATSHWLCVPMLKPFGVEPVGDERIVREGKIVTAAGVSAGIDLGLWLFGQICGDAKAKAVQLVIEYDPQPPYDSGHMSKASAATKAAATAALSVDTVKGGQLAPTVQLLWGAAIDRVRSGRKKSISV